jgi:hypothetical protein
VLRGSVKTVIIVLAINGWMVYARMTRGVVLSMKERPFVEAAEIIGAKPRRVIMTHVLPNLVSPLATLATLEFARIILAEAALSFLGLGIQFPDLHGALDAAQGGSTSSATRGRDLSRASRSRSSCSPSTSSPSWLRVAFDPQEREKRHAATVIAGPKQL